MACHLRVSGRTFDVERYLERTTLPVVAVYKKGEPVFPSKPDGPKVKRSGCNIRVSNRDFSNFSGQIRDAVRFLKENSARVRALRRFPGVESATLDFGIVWEDVIVQYDKFSEELVALAAKCGLALEVSHYPVSGNLKRKAKSQSRSKPKKQAPTTKRKATAKSSST